MEWMILPLKRYADFSGRSRRKEYWMFALFNIIVFAVLGSLMFMGSDVFGTGSLGPLGWLAAALIGLFWLVVLIPGIAVQVRRFHDQDKSGWFVLLNFVPYVGGLIVFIFMCLEGTRGPNRYGPDPKQMGENAGDIFA
jgi:uncharacterized membrane protein YhaH (DUF805 family)